MEQDRETVLRCAMYLAGSAEKVERLLEGWYAKTESLVESSWRAITVVAEELRRDRVLSGQRVRQIVSQDAMVGRNSEGIAGARALVVLE